jgi:dTDP-4-dehydrorhamnose reductase
MKRLWITGISGFLGWYLGQTAGTQFQILGTYYRQPITDPNWITTALDLTDARALKAWLSKWRPDAVIHTAAWSKPNVCERNPAQSYAVNVTATLRLAECCAEAEIPLVFTSSEQVFDGQHPPYAETDIPCPVNRYGEQKAEAEDRLRMIYPQAVICRLPVMFGAATPTASSFLQEWLSRLQGGQSLSLFTDEIRTPLSVQSAVEGLLLALQHPGIGRLHLGGPTSLSRYELGCLIAEIWGFPRTLLTPCYQADVSMSAPRPANVSMRSERAYRLGYRPDPPRLALEKLKTQGPFA